MQNKDSGSDSFKEAEGDAHEFPCRGVGCHSAPKKEKEKRSENKSVETPAREEESKTGKLLK